MSLETFDFRYSSTTVSTNNKEKEKKDDTPSNF